jgi:hypothetical protein
MTLYSEADEETMMATHIEHLTQRRTEREHKKIDNIMKNTY